MSFENPQKFGTPIFTEKEAYEMQKGINKMLWEGKETKVEVKEETKKSGFCK